MRSERLALGKCVFQVNAYIWPKIKVFNRNSLSIDTPNPRNWQVLTTSITDVDLDQYKEPGMPFLLFMKEQSIVWITTSSIEWESVREVAIFTVLPSIFDHYYSHGC